MQYIANNLNSAAKITRVMKSVNSVQATRKPTNVNSNWVEKQIIDIWQDVLGGQHVGLNDSFYDVGGTSLKGVQVIAKMNQKLGASLTIVDLFEHPTVQRLGNLLNREAEAIPDKSKKIQRSSSKRRKIISRKRASP